MITNTFLAFAHQGIQALALLALMYLAVRYFDGRLTRSGALRLAAFIVLPTLTFGVLSFVFPYKWTVWPAWYVQDLDFFINVWTVLIPAVVFLILWKGLSLNLQIAALYTGLFVVLGLLSNHIYSVLNDLLPPYSRHEPERKIVQALISLVMLLIPVSVFLVSRALRFRIPLSLGCFGIALLFSPVVVYSYGKLVVWSSMYSLGYPSVADGPPFTMWEAMRIAFALISVVASTAVLTWLYRFAQRFRIPE